MFDNIGWSEILMLVVAALFILGPDRLPQAASWLGKNLRKLREVATGVRIQLHNEIGAEVEEFRQPLAELHYLRSFDPKRAISQHLFDADTDPLGLRTERTPVASNQAEQAATTPQGSS